MKVSRSEFLNQPNHLGNELRNIKRSLAVINQMYEELRKRPHSSRTDDEVSSEENGKLLTHRGEV